MATKLTRIRHKRGTAAALASVNPVLADGEMCFEEDTRRFKFGDGVSAWNDLPYAVAEGVPGPTGVIGPSGPQGTTGPTGATGIQGPTGVQGATGATGDLGITGATGPLGPPGATGPAPAVEAHPTDADKIYVGGVLIAAAQGATGPQGPSGATGVSPVVTAHETDPDKIYVGGVVVQAAQGATGPIGITGATGPQGFIGVTGATGVAGPQGITGPQGPQGATGATGPVGPQGPAGLVLVSSANSKTGDVTLNKADVGLGNVDNTADVNKPVSTAQQAALNLKANTANPVFTGTSTHASGSAAAPAVTFSNTNSGIFAAANGDIGITVGGVARMTVGLATQIGNNLIVQGISNSFPAGSINSDALGPLVLIGRSGNYTLAVSDAGRIILANGSAAQTITIPTNSVAALPVGVVIEILCNNPVAGAVSITAAAGVAFFFNTGTLGGNSSGGATVKLRENVTSARLLKVAVNTWYAFGDLIP